MPVAQNIVRIIVAQTFADPGLQKTQSVGIVEAAVLSGGWASIVVTNTNQNLRDANSVSCMTTLQVLGQSQKWGLIGTILSSNEA